MSFHEAATVLEDPLSTTFPDEEHAAAERRFVTIGASRLGLNHCSYLRSRGDSNPHQRTLDLFEARHFNLARLLPSDAFFRRPRRLIGPPDETLRALAAEGLTLREIAEQVGMSAEGVRLRLAAPAG